MLQAENGDPWNILAETQGLPGVYDTVVEEFIPGDLSAQDLDWNNPGASVTITRIDEDDDDNDDDD